MQTSVSRPGRDGLPVPLTFQQQWIWSAMLEEESFQRYRVYALRLVGAMSAEIFHTSLLLMWRRHAALRTRIVMIEGTAHQIAADAAECPLIYSDATHAAGAAATQGSAREQVENFFTQSMDVNSGPLVEFRLIRLAEREHVLALKIHHLVTDHLSEVLFFRELWLVYGNLMLQRAPFAASPPLQYTDYAVWQAQEQPAWLVQHYPYWERKLHDAPAIRMPTDAGISPICAGSATELRVAFAEPLSSRLLQWASQQRTMPALVMLTLYAGLVFHWCGQQEFVIPYAVAGRQLPQHVNVLGPFAHLLFLRVQLSGTQTFSDLLRQLTREFFTAWKHFDHGRLSPGLPHLTRSTLLEWLSWQTSELQGTRVPTEWEGRQPCPLIEPFPADRPRAHNLRQESEITLYFWRAADGIRAHGYYRTDLFSPGTMQRFQEALLRIASHMVQEPGSCLASFRM